MDTLKAFDARFPDEDACKQYLVEKRWANGEVCCPRCGHAKVYKLKKPFTWQCQACQKSGYRFSPLVGTIFQDTKYPLKVWFKVAYLMLVSKKGVSALQIQGMMKASDGSDYRTFWFMCHRLRAAMNNKEFEQLMGTVEVDETYIGGKDKNRHADKKSHQHNPNYAKKTAVIGAISRKGNVVCKIIERVDRASMMGFVKTAVSDKVDIVMTDEHKGYDTIGYHMKHGVVKHMDNVYVRGKVHTQNIESFWGLLKRGIVGTFHNVSADYLPLYLTEFSFRHNNRGNDDMFGELISRA